MSRALIFLLLFTLAACGPRLHQVPVRAVAAHSRASTPPATVVSQQFGDLHPTDWQGNAPQRYAVHGIDVSVWQGAIDWRQARAGGVNFVFMKATEGGDRVDPNFGRNWQAAAAAGVWRGGYHLFYHCRPAVEQARWYIRNVPRSASALPPVLDMEWTPTSPTCRIRQPPAVIRAEARAFLSVVGAHYGKRPILYTTPDFFHDNDLGQLSGVTFWLRSVAAPVAQTYPGQAWTFWQYSGTGQVQGIGGKVDLNAFAGTRQGWTAFAGG